MQVTTFINQAKRKISCKTDNSAQLILLSIMKHFGTSAIHVK